MEEIADARKLRLLKGVLRKKMRTRKEFKAASFMLDRSAQYLRFRLRQLKKRHDEEEDRKRIGPDGKRIPTMEEQAIEGFRRLKGAAADRALRKVERKWIQRMMGHSKLPMKYFAMHHGVERTDGPAATKAEAKELIERGERAEFESLQRKRDAGVGWHNRKLAPVRELEFGSKKRPMSWAAAADLGEMELNNRAARKRFSAVAA
eukprot:CAMPEP_0167781024 /NCGR_PEP_ID=MMETSP0111_2-20121227/5695_1 /TAXON_ID=91324 /ORGANISM="Lotharella globosa, Strain CCCM811" /LENGTH=204 /DNA_ID=CAMNT_0007671625 /DNA_START=76 /DNA_END=690 /DNA_ORIENTATION=+